MSARISFYTHLLYVIGASMAMSTPSAAQCTANGPDTSFGQDSNITGYIPQFFGNRPSYVRIPRVVGPGTAAELTPSNELVNFAVMKQNGVLGPDAYVHVSGFLILGAGFWELTTLGGAPSAAEALITFTLNGHPIGGEYSLYASMNGPTPTGASFAACVKVSHPEYLRFGRKLSGGGTCPPTTPSRPNETTCPGVNEVEAQIKLRVGPTSIMTGPGAGVASIPFLALTVYPGSLLSTVSASGSADRIKFKAMAPVVMVHGIRTTSDWFRDYTHSPLDVRNGGTVTYQNNWFTKPFVDAKVPFESVDFNEAVIRRGGGNLATNVTEDANHTPVTTHPVSDAAAEFGATRIHIVAHSMGGLWTRAFLEDQLGNLPIPLGILSFTTITTPHHGSYNADLLDMVRRYKGSAHLSPQQHALDSMGPSTPGIPDLTTWNTEYFNLTNHLPQTTTSRGFKNVVNYQSVAADANIDGSCFGGSAPCNEGHPPSISSYPSALDESEGYEYPDPDVIYLHGLVVVDAGYRLYDQLWRYRTVALQRCFAVAYCVNDIGVGGLNDFQVTVRSAQYQGFNQIAFVSHNHTTVGKPDVGSIVLTSLFAREMGLP